MEITKAQLNQFDQVGFFKMDRVISRKGFQEIRVRMEDITQGRIQYSGMSFQLDGSSKAHVLFQGVGCFRGRLITIQRFKGGKKTLCFLSTCNTQFSET